MKCAICEQDGNQALVHLGGYCSPEHRQVLLDRHWDLLEELRQEEVLLMPDHFGMADFERLALKLAVHLLLRMSPELLQGFREIAPHLLDPLEMALELKDLILHQLPESHVRLREATGLQRFFFGGTYSFTQPVPVELVRKALVAAHIIDERAFSSSSEPL